MCTARRTVMLLAVGVAGMVSLASPGAASAQNPRARPDAFTGCWRAVSGTPDNPMASAGSEPLVCVVPVGDSLVISTVADGRLVSRASFDVNGHESAFNASGCQGTQSARWSSDGRRLYTRSASTCSGLQRNTSGLFALTASGDWLDVQSVSAGEGSNVRVVRYRAAGNGGAIPSDVVAALGDRMNAVQASRLAAGSPVTTADVMETAKAVAPAVTEAWLLERHQQFAIDAGQLAAMADAGMPTSVIDAMVASSYPATFTVAHVDGPEGERASIALVPDTVYTRRRTAYVNPWAFSPYGYAGYYETPWGPAGYYGLDDYGSNDYGSGYGYGGLGYYGYGSAYYGGYGAYGYRPPVIIYFGNVVPGVGGAPAHVVKGKGYTRDQAPAPAATGSRSPAPSSSGSASGSSSSGGSSTTRTAKPRSP